MLFGKAAFLLHYAQQSTIKEPCYAMSRDDSNITN
jgi:hypothetical protein